MFTCVAADKTENGIGLLARVCVLCTLYGSVLFKLYNYHIRTSRRIVRYVIELARLVFTTYLQLHFACIVLC